MDGFLRKAEQLLVQGSKFPVRSWFKSPEAELGTLNLELRTVLPGSCPGRANRVGDGDAGLVAPLGCVGDNLAGQVFLAAEEYADAGNIKKETIGATIVQGSGFKAQS